MNVQTLRYYERRGILPEPQRSASGYRSYDDQAVRTVRFAKGAQQLGFSLEEIGSLLELAVGGPRNCDAAKKVATAKIGRLEAKIARLAAMRDSLRQLVATCDRRARCRDPRRLHQGHPSRALERRLKVSIGKSDKTGGPGAPCGGRALCGWSPPSLPADSEMKRRVDRIRLGNAPAVGVVIVVVALLNVAAHLSVDPALAVDGLAGLAAGGWCSLNYWRCRHAHCLVTGPGWLAFGVFAFVEAGIGHSLIDGYEQPAFIGILGVAVIFELSWYLARRTNAITSPAR